MSNNHWLRTSGIDVDAMNKEDNRKQMLDKMNKTIKECLQDHFSTGKALTESSPYMNSLCNQIELFLTHKLKVKYGGFGIWDILQLLKGLRADGLTTHGGIPLVWREQFEYTDSLSEVTTDSGKAKAFIRRCLNEAILNAAIESISTNHDILRNHYEESSILRYKDDSDVYRSILTPLETIPFQIDYNDNTLDHQNANDDYANIVVKSRESSADDANGSMLTSGVRTPPVIKKKKMVKSLTRVININGEGQSEVVESQLLKDTFDDKGVTTTTTIIDEKTGKTKIIKKIKVTKKVLKVSNNNNYSSNNSNINGNISRNSSSNSLASLNTSASTLPTSTSITSSQTSTSIGDSNNGDSSSSYSNSESDNSGFRSSSGSVNNSSISSIIPEKATEIGQMIKDISLSDIKTKFSSFFSTISPKQSLAGIPIFNSSSESTPQLPTSASSSSLSSLASEPTTNNNDNNNDQQNVDKFENTLTSTTLTITPIPELQQEETAAADTATLQPLPEVSQQEQKEETTNTTLQPLEEVVLEETTTITDDTVAATETAQEETVAIQSLEETREVDAADITKEEIAIDPKEVSLATAETAQDETVVTSLPVDVITLQPLDISIPPVTTLSPEENEQSVLQETTEAEIQDHQELNSLEKQEEETNDSINKSLDIDDDNEIVGETDDIDDVDPIPLDIVIGDDKVEDEQVNSDNNIDNNIVHESQNLMKSVDSFSSLNEVLAQLDGVATPTLSQLDSEEFRSESDNEEEKEVKVDDEETKEEEECKENVNTEQVIELEKEEENEKEDVKVEDEETTNQAMEMLGDNQSPAFSPVIVSSHHMSLEEEAAAYEKHRETLDKELHTNSYSNSSSISPNSSSNSSPTPSPSLSKTNIVSEEEKCQILEKVAEMETLITERDQLIETNNIRKENSSFSVMISANNPYLLSTMPSASPEKQAFSPYFVPADNPDPGHELEHERTKTATNTSYTDLDELTDNSEHDHDHHASDNDDYIKHNNAIDIPSPITFTFREDYISSTPPTSTPTYYKNEDGEEKQEGGYKWTPLRRRLYFEIHTQNTIREQNNQCAGCSRNIAGMFRSARYCEYSGKYYCSSCHSKQVFFVPARILTNWDFKQYQVSNFHYQLLNEISGEPLFDIGSINPKLYKNNIMLRMRNLRRQMFFLKDFLKSCTANGPELSKLIGEKNDYLASDIDIFSLSDLVSYKQLFESLRIIVAKWLNHAESCPLCTVKGSFCEFCDAKDPIFPYHISKVVQCSECHSFHHKECYIKHKCPKCLRIAKRKILQNFEIAKKMEIESAQREQQQYIQQYN